MSKLRVHNFSVSLDGYAAGPKQGFDQPLGVGGEELHKWVFTTPSGKAMLGQTGGESGIDERFFAEGFNEVGATIMGRHMFGPVRGPWGSEEWKGWWGDDPPYHHPVFVLTHHPRPPLEMKSGTTFYFVDDTIEAVLERAFAAADGADVVIGGGASTVQQYLRAGLIDEMHFAIAPVLLGAGERLFDNLNGGPDGYECVELVSSPNAAHVRLARTKL